METYDVLIAFCVMLAVHYSGKIIAHVIIRITHGKWAEWTWLKSPASRAERKRHGRQ